ncbi:MAG: acyl carrier protein [Spirochaetes bacterium]|nr:acyl carrier protein [Spirochaetota bacterium]
MKVLLSKNEIFAKVKKLIAEVLNINEEIITENSRIIADLGAESLDIVTLLMEFEDAFNMKIPDDEAEELLTVADVIDYILVKVEDKAPA